MMCNNATVRKSYLLIAGSNLPKGATYGPITCTPLDFREAVFHSDTNPYSDTVQVHYLNGRLEAPMDCWERYLQAARDVHEQNLEVYRCHDNGLYIRTRRTVGEGEALSLWFEEGYGRLMGVPYLTIDHINGLGDYRCTNCTDRFSHPNPLKHHLMYDCNVNRKCTPQPKRSTFKKSFTIDQLLYLRRKCRLSLSSSNLRQFSSQLSLSKLNKIRNACWTSLSTDVTKPRDTTDQSYLHYSHKELMTSSQGTIPTTDQQKHISNDVNHLNHGLEDNDDEEPMNVLHKSFIEFSTQKGHLCVYCGKFYSRKYGLKIHLRTHTGYKPLKCSVCQRAFGDPSNLNKHIRLHAQGHTPYKCKHCGKVLVRRRDLIRHLASRHPGATKLTNNDFSRGNDAIRLS